MEAKDLRVSLETTGYRGNRVCLETSLTSDQTSCLETPREVRMMTAKGDVPKGCQGCRGWLVPREKRETRAGLA